MGSAASLLLLGAAIVAALGGVGVWWALKRPTQALQRRQRDEALAAAQGYTPAARVSPYGAPAAQPDPCAPGLSDGERVEAMRALLLRGDQRVAKMDIDLDGPATEPMDMRALLDNPPSTTPMAWNPTLPPDEAELIDQRRNPSRPRVREADVQHISIF